MINASDFEKAIFDVVFCYYSLPGLVIINSDFFYLLQNLLLLFYFYALDAVIYHILSANQGPIKKPNSNQQKISLGFQLDFWQDSSNNRICLPYWRQPFYMHFELNCHYCPCISKLKMLLPPRYLQKNFNSYLPYIIAGAAFTKKGSVYKNTI